MLVYYFVSLSSIRARRCSRVIHSSAPLHSAPLDPLAIFDFYLPQIRIRLQICCCLYRSFIIPLQVYAGMFLPLLRHLRPHPPRRQLTEDQNWSRCNTLRDRVLPLRDEFPDPLKA